MLSLLRACHPQPTVMVTLIATVLAIGAGQRPREVAVVAAAVLASQLSIGWGNDWLDAERDTVVGRTDKPVAVGTATRQTVGVAAVLAGVATIPLAFLSGVPAGVVAILALTFGWLYNAPLKRTALSPVPYVVSFAALPTFVLLATPGAPAPPWWLPVAGGLLGFGAHFANVLPDIDADLATGVRGLPHRVGSAGSRILAATGLLGASVVLALGPPGPPSWFGLAVVTAAVIVLPTGLYLGRSPGSRAAFQAVMAVAAADVVLLVVAGTGA